jgi:hypothetical protein
MTFITIGANIDYLSVIGLSAHAAECMDVVVYPLEKKHQVHG